MALHDVSCLTLCVCVCVCVCVCLGVRTSRLMVCGTSSGVCVDMRCMYDTVEAAHAYDHTPLLCSTMHAVTHVPLCCYTLF